MTPAAPSETPVDDAIDDIYVPGAAESMLRVRGVRYDGRRDLAVASMTCGPWTLDPDGQPSVGALGVLVDDVFGCAVIAHRPDDSWGITTEISLDFCSPLPADGSDVTAQAQAVHLDARGGLAQGTVTGADGRTLAVGTQRSRFVPGVPGFRPAPVADADADSAAADGLLDLLEVSSVRHEGGITLELPTGPCVANPVGNLHGGILLGVSELAGRLAVRSDEHPLQTASLHIAYLRPTPLTGGVRFTTQVLYRGRTSAVTKVRAVRADGKACSVATVTCH